MSLNSVSIRCSRLWSVTGHAGLGPVAGNRLSVPLGGAG